MHAGLLLARASATASSCCRALPDAEASNTDENVCSLDKAYQDGYEAGFAAADKMESSSNGYGGQKGDTPPSVGAATGSNIESNIATDSLRRSAVKGLIWRIFSTTATLLIALLIFQESIRTEDVLQFGAAEFATKYLLYLIHERLWAAIKFT